MDYWIAIDRQKIGPLTLEDVRLRRISPDTLVWHQGLPTWRRAAELPELADTLSTAPLPEPETAEWSNDEVEESVERPVTPPPYRPMTQSYVRVEPVPAKQPEEIPEKPATYTGWNIAATLLCCLLTGIIGLVYSSKVTARYNMGDYAGAKKASETAEMMLIVSIVVGLVMLPFQIIFSLV